MSENGFENNNALLPIMLDRVAHGWVGLNLEAEYPLRSHQILGRDY